MLISIDSWPLIAGMVGLIALAALMGFKVSQRTITELEQENEDLRSMLGVKTGFQMRVLPEFLGAIDEWRRKQSEVPSRAEATCHLVEQALRTKNKSA